MSVVIHQKCHFQQYHSQNATANNTTLKMPLPKIPLSKCHFQKYLHLFLLQILILCTPTSHISLSIKHFKSCTRFYSNLPTNFTNFPRHLLPASTGPAAAVFAHFLSHPHDPLWLDIHTNSAQTANFKWFLALQQLQKPKWRIFFPPEVDDLPRVFVSVVHFCFLPVSQPSSLL